MVCYMWITVVLLFQAKCALLRREIFLLLEDGASVEPRVIQESQTIRTGYVWVKEFICALHKVQLQGCEPSFDGHFPWTQVVASMLTLLPLLYSSDVACGVGNSETVVGSLSHSFSTYDEIHVQETIQILLINTHENTDSFPFLLHLFRLSLVSPVTYSPHFVCNCVCLYPLMRCYLISWGTCLPNLTVGLILFLLH
jgi:hypothetical protein